MTEATPTLQLHREAWKNKRVIRLIYEDYYRQISGHLATGNILEIGSGIGQYSAPTAPLTRTDIQFLPCLDFVADAQQLPLANASFNNIVMVDVLHHIEQPLRFINEARRILRPGGRLIMMEPAITPVSWFFYKYLHPEPVDFSYDPFIASSKASNGRNPYDANQAVPTILFRDSIDRFSDNQPYLRVCSIDYLSLIAYPLSGGFNRWSLLPAALAPMLVRFERLFPAFMRKLMAFRMLITLERQ